MTLKEELEILRGEPIKVFEGNPMDIPCIETSDAEKLCKHPVVSVHMITYNHEPYIRQAIEGVMMQETDFEFELVIGEDCSKDKTRDICFEYQQKYPDKIRVLWWHENVSKLGGNHRRVSAHCRGEFIAICEGDDYWIDPLKLQKQVDVMRKYPNVGFCFCGAKQFYQDENRFDNWNEGNVSYKPGIQNKEWFFTTFMFGMGPKYSGQRSFTGFLMTASTMVRTSLLIDIKQSFDIFRWQLRLADAIMWLACSTKMDGYYIDDQVAVYRIAQTGVFQNPVSGMGVKIDGIIIRLYFLIRHWNLTLEDCPCRNLIWLSNLVVERRKGVWPKMSYAWSQFHLPYRMWRVQFRFYRLPFWLCCMFGLYIWPFKNVASRIRYLFIKHDQWPQKLIAKYNLVGL